MEMMELMTSAAASLVLGLDTGREGGYSAVTTAPWNIGARVTVHSRSAQGICTHLHERQPAVPPKPLKHSKLWHGGSNLYCWFLQKYAVSLGSEDWSCFLHNITDLLSN